MSRDSIQLQSPWGPISFDPRIAGTLYFLSPNDPLENWVVTEEGDSTSIFVYTPCLCGKLLEGRILVLYNKTLKVTALVANCCFFST